jgi:hypothetical protein
MERNVHQPLEAAGAAGMHGRHTGNWIGVETPVPNESNAAGAFGNQERIIREESDGPRLLQMTSEHDRAKAALFRRFE